MSEEYNLADNVVWMEEMKPLSKKDLRRLPATEICKYLYKKIVSKALAGEEELLLHIPGDRYEAWMPLVLRELRFFFPDMNFEYGKTKEDDIEIYCFWGPEKEAVAQEPKADSVAVTIDGDSGSDSK